MIDALQNERAIDELFELLNHLNHLIDTKSDRQSFITKDLFLGTTSSDSTLIKEIIKYQMIPLIMINEFDDSAKEELTSLIAKLKDFE